MEGRRAWAFDDTIQHEAWNRSDQLRAILIFDAMESGISTQSNASCCCRFMRSLPRRTRRRRAPSTSAK